MEQFIRYLLSSLIVRLCSASSQASTVAPTEGMWTSFSVGPLELTTWTQYFPLCSNPLGCAVAMTALDVLVEENLAQRAFDLGEKFRAAVSAINSPLVKAVRGRGLLNAVVIDEEKSTRGRTAWQFCLLLKSRGVLAKPTHVNMYVLGALKPRFRHRSCPLSIRFAPPLVISEEDLMRGVKIIGECLADLDKVRIPCHLGYSVHS